MSAADNFEQVERNFQTIWMHKTKPRWIVYFDCKYTPTRTPFYNVYEVIGSQKKGLPYWANNNVLFGSKDGYPSLEEAMEAAA
jgi:hypothetical protein